MLLGFFYFIWILYTVGTLSAIILLASLWFIAHKEKKIHDEKIKKMMDSKSDWPEDSW